MPEICTNGTNLHAPDEPPIELGVAVGMGIGVGLRSPSHGRPVRMPDLRRRDARLHAEQIAGRARFLPRAERALIAAVYEQGKNISDLAALSGQSPRSLRRELRRIIRRITSPEFAYVVVNLDAWPVTMRRVAQSCILDGVPVRRASQSLRLSLHTVRKHRDMIRLLAVGAPLSGLAPARSKAG